MRCGEKQSFQPFEKKRDAARNEQFETADFETVSNGGGKSPLKDLLDKEFSAKVVECVAKLSPFQREVLILRETEELSYEEIAEITETDIGVVKSRLYRARRALGAELAPYLKNEEECLYEVH